MSNPWLSEWWRLAILLVVALVVGWLLGDAVLFLLLGVSGYLAWHLYQLSRLDKWLTKGKKRYHPPEASGVWGNVFQQIYRLQQRNRNRKRKLGRILNRFQEATAAMPDGAVVLGPDLDIEWFNSAAEKLLGLKQPQDVGQRVGNLVRHPDFTEYLAKGEFSGNTVLPAPGDDTLSISIRIVPYGKDQRLLVARDVTRLQRLEQMRRDFVANVSHELRTPLTVLRGYLETLADEIADQSLAGGIDSMQSQAARMQRIVDDLLMLARLESGQQMERADEVPVPELLKRIALDTQSLKGEKHRIEMEAQPGLWLRGSESELHSAFSNLILNAIRYTPEGGSIQVHWYADEDGAHFAVRDSGVGIATHHIPRLTERFYRVDVARSRATGGTGLGLAIVKHVLLCHEGHLSIESALGQGSTFTCHLPSARVILKPVSAPKGEESAGPDCHKTVI